MIIMDNFFKIYRNIYKAVSRRITIHVSTRNRKNHLYLWPKLPRLISVALMSPLQDGTCETTKCVCTELHKM